MHGSIPSQIINSDKTNESDDWNESGDKERSDANEMLRQLLQKAQERSDGGCRIILTVAEWRAAIAALQPGKK
jgi:uncharacterized protein YfcZ (UPF0381/DUF406 family)